MKDNFLLGAFLGVVIVSVLLILVLSSANTGRDVAQKEFNKCVEIAIKAIPNANEVEERSSIIKSCFEK